MSEVFDMSASIEAYRAGLMVPIAEYERLEAEVERLTKWANDANQLTLRYESRAKWLETENAVLKAKAALADEAATTFKFSKGDAGWRKGWLARYDALKAKETTHG